MEAIEVRVLQYREMMSVVDDMGDVAYYRTIINTYAVEKCRVSLHTEAAHEYPIVTQMGSEMFEGGLHEQGCLDT